MATDTLVTIKLPPHQSLSIREKTDGGEGSGRNSSILERSDSSNEDFFQANRSESSVLADRSNAQDDLGAGEARNHWDNLFM